MAEIVDSGSIIAVRRFDVTPQDSVYSLTQRCYAYLMVLYYDIVSQILRGEPLPRSAEVWSRRAYRRKELNALKRIELGMPLDEIRRRVKASAYPGTPGAYIEIDGMRFEYKPDDPL
jgi:methionyl-tRNA formyltransferase